jgi:hypothetical protein
VAESLGQYSGQENQTTFSTKLINASRPHAIHAIRRLVMIFLCLKELETLLPNIHEDACIRLLERVLRNCGCVRGRKAFPCLQDQTTITFLVQMSLKREDIRLYLTPYLEDILTIIIECLDQARNIDFDFLHSFLTKMLRIRCSVRDIITLLHDLSREDSNLFHKLLYCNISKYITDELTSDSVFSDLFPVLIENVCARSK